MMHNITQTGNTNSPAYYIWISILLACIVLAGYALVMSLLINMEIFEFSLKIPWAMLVSNYVFFVGSSIGLCIVSSLGYVFGMKRYEPIGRRGVFLAIITIIFGMSSIGFHLGHPERAMIYSLLTPNIRSAMWWMTTLYSFYIVFIVMGYWFLARVELTKIANSSTGIKQRIYSLMVLGKRDESHESVKKDHKKSQIVGALALISGLLALLMEGAVFGHTEARALWYGSYYPVYFLFSSASCGYAWLLIATIITYKVKKEEISGKLKNLIFEMAKIFALLLCVGLLFTSYKLSSGLLDPIKSKSIMLLLKGPFSLPFYLFEIAIGTVFPIFILLYSAKKEKIGGVLTASIMVLVGVFVMRYDFVVVGGVYPLFSPMGRDISVLLPSFFPALMEIYIVGGIIAACLLAYTLGVKYLPLKEESH
ncbi:MAG: NrfD/PsrC family molybdoenzyme membrane anchor subunit [Thermodesulfovibrionia bacterium]|nr:NrfD/PsrC family molybdoenzyme membrane anchor subunit [Thermodesulfovibrionia bacterium]